MAKIVLNKNYKKTTFFLDLFFVFIAWFFMVFVHELAAIIPVLFLYTSQSPFIFAQDND